MKNRLSLIALLIAMSFAFFSCEDDEVTPVDSSLPSGTFTPSKSGSFVAQNGTSSAGIAQLGTDAQGASFLYFGPNFTTELGTGTVPVYLSTSNTFTPDPANGNPNLKLVGGVFRNGQTYFKLNSTPEAKFTHVILWCGSAGIPFGFAPLQ